MDVAAGSTPEEHAVNAAISSPSPVMVRTVA